MVIGKLEIWYHKQWRWLRQRQRLRLWWKFIIYIELNVGKNDYEQQQLIDFCEIPNTLDVKNIYKSFNLLFVAITTANTSRAIIAKMVTDFIFFFSLHRIAVVFVSCSLATNTHTRTHTMFYSVSFALISKISVGSNKARVCLLFKHWNMRSPAITHFWCWAWTQI